MILRPFIDTENNLLHEKNHVTLCKNKGQAHFACLWSLDIGLSLYTYAVFLLSSIKIPKNKGLSEILHVPISALGLGCFCMT